MGHAVEKMVFTGKKPWWYGNRHQGEAVGVDLGDGPISSREAIKAAGLDWDVELVQAGYLDPRTTNVDGDPTFRSAGHHRFIVRDSDGALLGKCTTDYTPYQNLAAFEFLDGLVAQGEMLYHTAGSLDNGGRVWILAQLPGHWQVQRRSGAVNHHLPFLNCMLAHTGNAGISLMPTDVRVECANTAGFADSKAERQNLVFRIPHHGDIDGKMGLAAEAIRVTINQTDERRRVLQELANHAMSTDEFVDFATSIFLGLDGEADEIEERVAEFYEKATPRSKTIMENKVAGVAERFLKGMEAEGDSAYDALQAFTENEDHSPIKHVRNKIEAARKATKAVKSAWIGAGAERKALVYKRLGDLVRR